ncbi:hypothetical protein BC827DRAFT_1273130 [Russula dissimulans]|nr:hypothetical protein BC827DRAFT_1273130 [Russula dissimulans]
MCRIASTLERIISTKKLDSLVKLKLEAVHGLALEAEAEAREEQKAQEHESITCAIHKEFRADLEEFYKALYPLFTGIQNTADTILMNTGQLAKAGEESKAATVALGGKIKEVMEAVGQIVTGTETYQDALLASPSQDKRAETNPKVLSGLECRAKQILIDIYGEEGDTLLKGSLTTIVDKANEAVGKLDIRDKPADIKVLAALKARKNALLLTFNNKDAVN